MHTPEPISINCISDSDSLCGLHPLCQQSELGIYRLYKNVCNSVYGTGPSHLCNSVVMASESNDRLTQLNNTLQFSISEARIKSLERIFIYRGSKFWNTLPKVIHEAASSELFNVVLKDRLDRLKNIAKPQTLHAQCAKVFEKFKKGGFMALEDEHEERYIVLSSYHYIETFLNAIEVSANESA